MAVYHRSSLMGLLNKPLAMLESHAMSLRAALIGEIGVHARVRGLDSIPEIDAQKALSAMRGNATDALGNARRPYQISPTGIAVLPVNGMLVRQCDIWDRIFGGMTSYEDIAEQVLFAAEDDGCKAMFMPHNSPGGEVNGVHECADFIASCSARNGGKPIYGYAADQACSASYELLSACDRVFGGETCQVGSIGVLMMHADLTGMYEQDGIQIDILRSRPGKALGTMGTKLPEAEIARLQEQCSYLGSVFEKRVSFFMPNLTQTAVAETQGFDYIGPRAKAIGLVNDVLSMPEAWAKLERRIAR